MSTIGERVCAISHSSEDGKTTYIFGYGTYVADEVPETAAGQLGQMLRNAKLVNPKIVLDSGKVVWGCECWHGPEERVKKELADNGQTIVEVDVDESRANASKDNVLVDDELIEIEQSVEGEYPELEGIKKILELALKGCVGIEYDLIVPAVNIEMLNTFGFLQSKKAIKRVTNIAVELSAIERFDEQKQDWDTIPEVEVSLEFVLPDVNSEVPEERKVGLNLTLKKLTTEVS